GTALRQSPGAARHARGRRCRAGASRRARRRHAALTRADARLRPTGLSRPGGRPDAPPRAGNPERMCRRLRRLARRGDRMSVPAIVRDLVVAHTRALKLPGVARTFEPLARQARDAHWPHEDYLHEVLSAEQASRHESVIRQRLREARFPEVKTLDTFDFAAADGVSA